MRKQPLTEQQKQEIINSTLTNVELGKIYNRNHKTISGIRKLAGQRPRYANCGNYSLISEQIKIMLNPLISVREASEKSGASQKYIYTLRERHGIIYVKPKKEKVKRIQKPSPKMIKSKKPLPSIIKEAKKSKEHKEKVKLSAGMSHAEQEYLIRKKAKEIAKNNPLSEAEKMAKGTHRWVIRINKYGKKESALIKI